MSSDFFESVKTKFQQSADQMNKMVSRSHDNIDHMITCSGQALVHVHVRLMACVPERLAQNQEGDQYCLGIRGPATL